MHDVRVCARVFAHVPAAGVIFYRRTDRRHVTPRGRARSRAGAQKMYVFFFPGGLACFNCHGS